MDRAKILIAKGYFPSQLPPCFKTQDLSEHYADLHTEWIKLSSTMNSTTSKAPSSKAELFSVARVGHKRRITSLPNPVAQTFLAIHVAENWGHLLKHYRQSSLSSSRPRFVKNGSRAANIPSMQLLYERKVLRSAGHRFMLRTDISRFFPTVYTHSVPWAMHGKAIAKRNRKITAKYFGNLLDQSLRQAQDEQTIGLPIGPDTSHIIAEAIATSVDMELKKKLKKFPAGFRYVDDYYLFFATAEEAETALAALIRSLKEFELQINFEKTKMCSVIEITDDYWTHQLRSFKMSKTTRKQAADIHHFFELAKDLSSKNTDESVMTYALKRVSSILIRKENWNHFEAHVCHVALAYPNTLQTVARLFTTYADIGYPIGRGRLERLLNAIIEDHAPLGHHSEVAWCLWICKEMELSVTESNIELVPEVHSSVCALLLLDLASLGRLSKIPKHTYWKQAASVDALRGDLWLLSYEAGVRGWGGFSSAPIMSDPHFSLIAGKEIRFYNSTVKLAPIFHARPDVLRQRNIFDISEFYDLEDAGELIEFDESDGGYETVVLGDEFDNIDESDEDSDDTSLPRQKNSDADDDF